MLGIGAEGEWIQPASSVAPQPNLQHMDATGVRRCLSIQSTRELERKKPPEVLLGHAADGVEGGDEEDALTMRPGSSVDAAQFD